MFKSSSLSYAVRFRIGYDPRLVSEVLAIALRTIFSWQRRRARKLGITHPLPGAITLSQRYGSLLQFTPHFHSWLPDGVFYLDKQGALRLGELPPPGCDPKSWTPRRSKSLVRSIG